MSKTKKTENTALYSLTLKVNGLVFTAEGNTIADAFSKTGLTFQQVKTKGEITITKGDRTITRLLQLPKLRRVFLSKIIMSGIARDFDKLLA